MKNNVGIMQMESLEVAKQINMFIKQIKNSDVKLKTDFIKYNTHIIVSYVRNFLGMEYDYQTIEYKKRIQKIVEKCNSDIVLNSPDICTISDLMDDIEEITDKIIYSHREGQKVCECCGEKVFYRTLAPYYNEQDKIYNVEKHIYETINEDEYECPCCGAVDRDRLIILMLKKLGVDSNIAKEALLQIAPSKSIENWINANCYSLCYDSTDLYMNDVSFVSDIQNMSMVADESYDYVICSHVLEHVQDDKKAMKEMFRILKKDGFGLLLVPINLDMEKIDEEWGLSQEENMRRFGQHDHCRRYCKKGFVDRLKESGFYVHELGKSFFGSDAFRQNGLVDTSTLYVVTKKDGEIQELISEKEDSRKTHSLDTPLVSVIMSAYNHERYVAQAIESVLNQTYSNIEFLVADDNSTDGTAAQICKYDDKIDEIHLFDENAYGRLNFLSDIAKGKYIAVINSDDVWEKDKIQNQVAYMETHPENAACFTDVQCFDEDGREVDYGVFPMKNMKKEKWMRYFCEHGNCLAHPSIMIWSDLYRGLQHSGISVFRQLPDFWMWLKVIQNYEIHVIQKPLIRFRFHQQGDNANTSAFTNENIRRHYWEESYLWYDIMKKMDIDYFKKTFYDDMVNKDASTDEEILCEKFFVLKKFIMDRKDRIPGLLFFLYDICQDEKVVCELRDRYGFNYADMYMISVQGTFMF